MCSGVAARFDDETFFAALSQLKPLNAHDGQVVDEDAMGEIRGLVCELFTLREPSVSWPRVLCCTGNPQAS